MNRKYLLSIFCAFAIAFLANPAVQAQVSLENSLAAPSHGSGPARVKTGLLQQFNQAMEELTDKVTPAVVQVVVTGYGPTEDGEKGATTDIVRQHSLGSGVIVDSDGYIVTNAHVVEGAQRIRVSLSKPVNAHPGADANGKTVFDAKLIGTHEDSDLALLKIEATGLPFMPVDPSRTVRQGQLVIALGSPEGLENSVTMGVVSAVGRQADPDRAMVYIQTDAPINRGNSGGPLVDIDGYLVGINTFILSNSGGSEGLGFAIPAKVVKFICDKLRKQGHVDRSEIGAAAQAITPTMAEGLHLAVNSGVIISDIDPDGPATSAGLKVGDIVLTVDGAPIESLPILAASLYLHPTDQIMTMVVLRNRDKVTLHVPVIPQRREVDRLVDLADPEKNVVGKLGVLAIDLDGKVAALMPDLRMKSGAVVVARTSYRSSVVAGLMPGDVIHTVNTTAVNNLNDLREAVKPLKFGDAVVLQIEREGKLEYVPFEFE